MQKSAEAGGTPLRIITAAAIFDGHDAAIGIFRRIFQSMGCEVIHLGHDRGADEVARAAIQEDAHCVGRDPGVDASMPGAGGDVSRTGLPKMAAFPEGE